MRAKFYTFTEQGPRVSNQDYFRVVMTKERSLFIVCDGLGGHALGDVASRVVGDVYCDYWLNNPEECDSEDKVFNARVLASDAIEQQKDTYGNVEMGTTLVMASLENEQLLVAHVGDSRCYVVRDGGLIYRTRDHVTDVNGSTKLTRCFFTNHRDAAFPDIKMIPVKIGDRFLLCSDGVYNSMPPEILHERLADKEDPISNVTDAVKFLCEKNAKDNYTAIFVEIVQD